MKIFFAEGDARKWVHDAGGEVLEKLWCFILNSCKVIGAHSGDAQMAAWPTSNAWR
jgi:hypothetical protein